MGKKYLYDANLIPDGWGNPSGFTWLANEDKSSIYWSEQNSRVTITNTDGQRHWTNQNLPKGDPNRHTPPK